MPVRKSSVTFPLTVARLYRYPYPMESVQKSLENYRLLVARVDVLCNGIIAAFHPHITCNKGCDSCCRHLSLFPVEGVALAAAVAELPADAAAYLRQRAGEAAADGPCPLLMGGQCLLYAARPLICRTHGLPILTMEAETRRVDFCPSNFTGLASLPGEAVIHLDRLNASLAAVNAHFTAHGYRSLPPGTERLTIAEALLLKL